jgi:hypothetical protein
MNELPNNDLGVIESVWNYPRPPVVEDISQRIKIILNGELIVDSQNAKRCRISNLESFDLYLKKLTVNGREKLHIMMSSLMTILPGKQPGFTLIRIQNIWISRIMLHFMLTKWMPVWWMMNL